MTLPVPLTVSIGEDGSHITDEVQSLSFRKEAIGGVRSISLTLARPLSDLNGLDPLSKVRVFDARNALTVAEGRLADTGRTASADGERWDCVAFGPAQHASDITRPLVYVDRSLENWRFNGTALVGAGAQFGTGPWPGTDVTGLLATWADGTALSTGSMAVMRHALIAESAQEIASFTYSWDAGITEPAWRLDFVASTAGGTADAPFGNHGWTSVASGLNLAHLGVEFTAGRNTMDIRTFWNGGSGTIVGDDKWVYLSVAIETTRYFKDGAVITAGYDGTPQAHQIIWDLLGRMLPEFDGRNAIVSTAGTFQIQHMTYPDGVTAEQVLADLMQLEPAFRWTTTPDQTGNGYGFSWAPWPTTVRYEATLDDGGSFPVSAQGLFNRAWVRWQDEAGRPKWTLRARACPALDDMGLTRDATVDLGSDAGSLSQAQRAGDAFLEEHNVPKNAGTLTVARPIRDVITGALVMPWEIEPGELVRIYGVEAYPDAFNASTNDGQGVFRIHAVDYNSDGNSATLALDSDPRETEDALVLLFKERSRGRR